MERYNTIILIIILYIIIIYYYCKSYFRERDNKIVETILRNTITSRRFWFV
jgi:hypothetical protein